MNSHNYIDKEMKNSSLLSTILITIYHIIHLIISLIIFVFAAFYTTKKKEKLALFRHGSRGFTYAQK